MLKSSRPKMMENSTDETLKLVGKLNDWTLVCLFVIGCPINMFSLSLLLQKMISFHVCSNGFFNVISIIRGYLQSKTCCRKSIVMIRRASNTSYTTNREECEIIRGTSFAGRKTRQKSSIIHNLLLLLCVSDLCVITGMLASFSLPNIWPGFNKNWLYLAPWWIPILQIALLTSVYTTVLISLERYVRIVYVCNFKHCWFFNSQNFKYYLISILTLPTIFFLPKFFELRLETKLISNQMSYNCSMHKYITANSQTTISPFLTNLVPVATSKSMKTINEFDKKLNETESACEEILQLINNTSNRNLFEESRDLPEISLSLIKREELILFHGRINISYEIVDRTAFVNILDSTNTTLLDHTDLRKNSLYYNVYILGLTTTLTQIIPMAILIYINISICSALKASRAMRRDFLSHKNDERGNRLPLKKLVEIDKGNSCSKEMLNGNDAVYKKSFLSDKRSVLSPFICQRHSTLSNSPPSGELQSNIHYGHKLCSRTTDKNPTITKATKKTKDQKSCFQMEEPKCCSKTKPSDTNSISSVKSANDIDRYNNTCYLFDKREKYVTVVRSKSLKSPYSKSEYVTLTRIRLRKSISSNQPNKECIKWTNNRDSRNTIEQSLDNGSIVKFEVAENKTLEAKKSTRCRSKMCSSKMFLKNEKSMTRASIMIVWLSIGCHIWRMVPNIYEAIYPNAGTGDHPIWLAYFSMASHILIAFNSSVNFLIYLF